MIARRSVDMRSRAGITLVEVMVALVISVMVIGGASYALFSVLGLFKNAGAEISGYQQALTVQSMLDAEAARALQVDVLAAAPDATYSTFGFVDEGEEDVFRIYVKPSSNSSATTVVKLRSIESITLEFTPLGARSRLDYVIRTRDRDTAYTLDGGIVMNNVAKTAATYTITPESGTMLVVRPAPTVD